MGTRHDQYDGTTMSFACTLKYRDDLCKTVKRLCDQGLLQEALGSMKSVDQSFPDHVISYFLQVCIRKRDLQMGREVHVMLTKSSLPVNAYIGSYLIRMFDACDSLTEATEVFDRVWIHNCYTWSAIILAHVNHGKSEEGIGLYYRMHQAGRKPDEHTYVATLKACINLIDLALGKVIHSHVVESCFELDVVIGNALVDMYAKCGSVIDGRCVFDALLERDAVSWNAMIGGYTQRGLGLEACCLFGQMQYQGIQPDTFTFVSIFKACAIMQAFHQGKFLHSIAFARGFACDKHIGTALIDMYSKCRQTVDAQKVFEDLPSKNLVTWNAMIAGYVHQACCYEAFQLYHQLEKDGKEPPDSVTYISILKACSILADVEFGKLVHDCTVNRGFDSDVFVGNTLIDMYAKCGLLEEADNVFDKLPIRDVVTWNAIISAYGQQGHVHVAFQLFRQMKEAGLIPDITTWNALIAGYVQHGHGEEALGFFQLMQNGEMKPDNVTLSSILKACSSLTALNQGKLMHSYAIESGELDAFIESALVDMYIKSGSLEDALKVFQSLSEGDVVTCNAMLMGYALHNKYNLALYCLKEMQQQGLKPDKVTFMSLLSLCSRLGLVEAACQHIQTMTSDHGLLPSLGHYSCIVDILGRVGRLDEAKDLLQTIPSGYNILQWTSLLTNCRMYGDVGLGRQCFFEVVASEQTFGSAYVMLSNIYAEASSLKVAGTAS